jgi:hypothetical protein
MTALKFQRNEKTGNLFARVGRAVMCCYYNKIGSFSWRIRTTGGEDRHSQHTFDTEQAALDDLLDNLGELLAIAQVLAEAPRDDDDTA